MEKSGIGRASKVLMLRILRISTASARPFSASNTLRSACEVQSVWVECWIHVTSDDHTYVEAIWICAAHHTSKSSGLVWMCTCTTLSMANSDIGTDRCQTATSPPEWFLASTVSVAERLEAYNCKRRVCIHYELTRAIVRLTRSEHDARQAMRSFGTLSLLGTHLSQGSLVNRKVGMAVSSTETGSLTTCTPSSPSMA